MARIVVPITPCLGRQQEAFFRHCEQIVREYHAGADASPVDVINALRWRHVPEAEHLSFGELKLTAVLSVLIDLVGQGWILETSGGEVCLQFENGNDESLESGKERIRRSHLVERDSQLREPSVSEFVRGMEKKRLTIKGWHSIYSLMRDGRDLAERLQEVLGVNDEEMRAERLARIIDPYVQFVDSEATCEHTGLRLNDVWRYFRHTWVNSYKSIPGRSVMILVRDAAAPLHPVIGIAALGSSVVQQSVRDAWIGWDAQRVVERFVSKPPRQPVQWLVRQLEALIRGVYIKDLISDELVTRAEIAKPSEEVIARLLRESQRAIEQHRRYPHAAKHKQPSATVAEWKQMAQTSLFRSKRAKILATLLSIRRVFQTFDLTTRPHKKLAEALASARFRMALGQLFRMIKSERVGVNMMDITVCGAIAPYNALLGGKLVCLMLCSPEIVQYYARRYGGQTSVIASAMSGKTVTKRAQLVLLCTTSLYGSALSQYSRVKVPIQFLDPMAEGKVEFRDLGLSEGFGSFHFSKDTIRLFNVLLGRAKDSRKVNSIFGEGVNPLMRKIREGLDLVGLPGDALLRHGNKRIVYGVSLATNFQEVLLNFSKRPKYRIPQTEPHMRTRQLGDFWRRRWLSNRLKKAGILEEVRRHTLVYPIHHGAQVPIAEDESELLELWTAQ